MYATSSIHLSTSPPNNVSFALSIQGNMALNCLVILFTINSSIIIAIRTSAKIRNYFKMNICSFYFVNLLLKLNEMSSIVRFINK